MQIAAVGESKTSKGWAALLAKMGSSNCKGGQHYLQRWAALLAMLAAFLANLGSITRKGGQFYLQRWAALLAKMGRTTELAKVGSTT